MRVPDHIIRTDRDLHVPVGDGAAMTLPMPQWLWQLNHVRPEPPRGTLCDDRMLVVSSLASYLYLVEECTKEEAWRRIKILRAAMKAERRADAAGVKVIRAGYGEKNDDGC